MSVLRPAQRLETKIFGNFSVLIFAWSKIKELLFRPGKIIEISLDNLPLQQCIAKNDLNESVIVAKNYSCVILLYH